MLLLLSSVYHCIRSVSVCRCWIRFRAFHFLHRFLYCSHIYLRVFLWPGKYDSDYYYYCTATFSSYFAYFICVTEWVKWLKHSFPSGTHVGRIEKNIRVGVSFQFSPSQICTTEVRTIGTTTHLPKQWYNKTKFYSFFSYFIISPAFSACSFILMLFMICMECVCVRARSLLYAHDGLAVSHARKPYCWCLILYVVLRSTLLTNFCDDERGTYTKNTSCMCT